METMTGCGRWSASVVVMNSYTTPSDLHSQSSRIGVYLDHSAGILSFITSVKPLKPRLSSTESRTDSVGQSVLDLAYIILKLLLNP